MKISARRRQVTLGALTALTAGVAAEVLASVAPQGPPSPPSELSLEIPSAERRGSARLRFFGLHIYDIRLWLPAGHTPEAALDGRAPMALEIEYARALRGELIAQRSIDEMRRVGEFSDEQAGRWLASMKGLFPDVGAGDRITGVQRPGGNSRFYANGQLRGEVTDLAFTRLFFGIWLSPRTSEPALRLQLLGLRP